MDIVNEYLAKTFNGKKNECWHVIDPFSNQKYQMVIRKQRVTCNDGFSVSIQASSHHYCEPRETFCPENSRIYTSVELGFPSKADELITDYAEDKDIPTDTVYGFVPVEIVAELIKKHGGIKPY